jgi:hypothetical protein
VIERVWIGVQPLLEGIDSRHPGEDRQHAFEMLDRGAFVITIVE